jgi:Archaea-specific RecJ-like exonuclease, contains DnaJ-type Zn finger domain
MDNTMLLPCPFCGGTTNFVTMDVAGKTYTQTVRAECSECFARVPEVPASDLYDAHEIVAGRWNRRERTRYDLSRVDEWRTKINAEKAAFMAAGGLED